MQVMFLSAHKSYSGLVNGCNKDGKWEVKSSNNEGKGCNNDREEN